MPGPAAGRRPPVATRRAALARAGYGLALVIAAPVLLRRVQPDPPPHAVPVARLLGLRELAQGAVTALHPSDLVRAAGSVTDGLHLASMVGVAAVSRSYRRLGVAAAAQAGCDLALDLAVSRRRR